MEFLVVEKLLNYFLICLRAHLGIDIATLMVWDVSNIIYIIANIYHVITIFYNFSIY